MPVSVFANYEAQNYPHVFEATLAVDKLVGGTPSDPKVAEGWLRSKLGLEGDQLTEAVSEIMYERAGDVTQEEAIAEAVMRKHLNGFRRGQKEDGEHAGELYIEGRQVKAAIKEAANVAQAAGAFGDKKRWGLTSKGLLGFIAEHIFVVENRLWLGVFDGDEDRIHIEQKFVQTFRGSGISYEEAIRDVEVHCTVETDWEFTDQEWAAIWTHGERQGLGASRSQGFGKYMVTRWDKVS